MFLAGDAPVAARGALGLQLASLALAAPVAPVLLAVLFPRVPVSLMEVVRAFDFDGSEQAWTSFFSSRLVWSGLHLLAWRLGASVWSKLGEVIGGWALAGALLGYLIAVLLRPEDFS